MIIGSGLLGKEFNKFKHSNDTIIVAAGVSNSQEKSPKAFKREIDTIANILNKKIYGQKVYYISTCSIYQNLKSPYIHNKILVEEMVLNDSPFNKVFRLPNVIGKTSNSTMISYFFYKILMDEKVTVQTQAVRQFIDVYDAAKIISYISLLPNIDDRIINVTNGVGVFVSDVVDLLAKKLNKSPEISYCKSGESYSIPNDVVRKYYTNTQFYCENYLEDVIDKYMGFYIQSSSYNV